MGKTAGGAWSASKGLFLEAGGEGEIRTRGTLSSTSAFEAGAFNHSATSPFSSKSVAIRRLRAHVRTFRLYQNPSWPDRPAETRLQPSVRVRPMPARKAIIPPH